MDAAYDRLLMQSFKSRQSGTTAGDNIKYADVSKPKPPQLPSWAKSGLNNLPSAGAVSVPTVSAVSGDDATKQAAVFAVLLLWSTVQGLSDPNVRHRSTHPLTHSTAQCENACSPSFQRLEQR